MNFFTKINRYLLERYPTIWNTKLVWMLLAAFACHILFFIIGAVFYANPTQLHNTYISDDYFTSGIIFINVIISLILLVLCISQLLKNNALKDYYPTTPWQIAGQFIQYIIIVLSCISFYISFKIGNQLFINYKYGDKKFSEMVQTANMGNALLGLDLENYTLVNRKYPSQLNNSYTETDDNKINFEKPYYKFLDDEYYQFYSVYLYKAIKYNNAQEINDFSYENDANFAYSLEGEKERKIYFKKEVIDLRNTIKSATPNYRNFSKVLFDPNFIEDYSYKSDVAYEPSRIDPYQNQNIKSEIKFNTALNELLNRKNPEEIKNIQQRFLALASELKIEHNLSLNNWFKNVYHPETDFDIEKFYRNAKKMDNEDFSDQYAIDSVSKTTDTTSQEIARSVRQKYYLDRLSNDYFRNGDLGSSLANIYQIKYYDDYFQSFNIFLWMAMGLSLVLFIFRTSNLRLLLLAGVTSGVVAMIMGLIGVLVGLSMNEFGEWFMMIFLFLLGTFIIFNPIIATHRGRKNFFGILINMAIGGFPLYVALIITIIDKIQQEYNKITNPYQDQLDLKTLWNYLPDYIWSIIIFGISIIFYIFYSKIILKWRAAAE